MTSLWGIAELARHEIHDQDWRIDLYSVTKHTIGDARSLVAYAERCLDGQWVVYTVHPAETAYYLERFHAWMHLYHHAHTRERPAEPPQSHAEPLTEQQG
jgi:hypothetical protein